MKNIFLIVSAIILSNSPIFNYAQDAYALRRDALEDLKHGHGAAAQEKLIVAHDLFLVAKNWDMASMCLYERAIEYMNIGDLANMRLQLLSLNELAENHKSILVSYNYHSVASGYYSHVEDSVDMAIHHGKLAIHSLEQIIDYQKYSIVPAWSYYNIALFYDMLIQPPLTDSVHRYLSLTREVIAKTARGMDSIETLISVIDLEAWQEYYVKDYQHAELMMKQVLELIDSVALTSPNTVITERGEAYKFLAMIYQDQGRWMDAFRCLELMLDNNELRYDQDKRMALQEVQTRYEVEKQQLVLDRLQAINRSRGWLLLAMLLILLLLVMSYVLLALRKMNVESQLYEVALEADNMRQELRTLESKTNVDPLMILVDELVDQLQSGRKLPYAPSAIARLRSLDLVHIQTLLNFGNKITTMDKRYILFFAAGMSAEQIADFLSLEPATVYTVRYRIRKKFPVDIPFPY